MNSRPRQDLNWGIPSITAQSLSRCRQGRKTASQHLHFSKRTCTYHSEMGVGGL